MKDSVRLMDGYKPQQIFLFSYKSYNSEFMKSYENLLGAAVINSWCDNCSSRPFVVYTAAQYTYLSMASVMYIFRCTVLRSQLFFIVISVYSSELVRSTLHLGSRIQVLLLLTSINYLIILLRSSIAIFSSYAVLSYSQSFFVIYYIFQCMLYNSMLLSSHMQEDLSIIYL